MLGSEPRVKRFWVVSTIYIKIYLFTDIGNKNG